MPILNSTIEITLGYRGFKADWDAKYKNTKVNNSIEIGYPNATDFTNGDNLELVQNTNSDPILIKEKKFLKNPLNSNKFEEISIVTSYDSDGSGGYTKTISTPDELSVPGAVQIGVTQTFASGEELLENIIGLACQGRSVYGNALNIPNHLEFDRLRTSNLIPPTNPDTIFKVIATSSGKWGNDIEIAIAQEKDFGCGALAFADVKLDSLYEYRPRAENEEFALMFKHGETIEAYTVSLDKTNKDMYNRSTHIEKVINYKSDLVYVVAYDTSFTRIGVVSMLYRENLIEEVTDKAGNFYDIPQYRQKLSSYRNTIPILYQTVTGPDLTPVHSYRSSRVQKLASGICSALLPGTTDLEIATAQAALKAGYDVWIDPEQVDIDIVIGNELDNGASAIELAMDRKDCIAFVGASYDTCVKKRSVSTAIQEIVALRDNRISFDTSYAAMFGNYKYQYDRFNDVARWVNIAGDCAGLRAQTNVSHASWWASAGLERGQLRNVTKLAFIPNNDQRDTLYKNSVNPITEFPGLGNVVWGQKTLQRMASSFDRINVRCLFNTLERSMSKMSKYQVFEFNDDFTRNRILSMMNPFLESVKSGRGIADYRVICDRTNNTPDIISRNQMMIDILIKPNYVAEFITLRFFNLGVNDFESVVL